MTDPADTQLEAAFHQGALDVYTDAGKATGYWANRYLGAIKRHGGLAYARGSLAKAVPQAGLGRLQEEGRLDLSLEALVLEPRFRSLFTPEELATARQRLESVGYHLPA